MPPATSFIEETLDPADWNQFEALAHQALSDAITYLKTVRSRPPWQPLPLAVQQRLSEAVPLHPTPLAEVYEQARRDIMPYPTGNIHPRFWGWVMGTGTADGLLADLLISAMNTHGAGYDQSAAVIERQVIQWFAALFGYGDEASGVFVSGGTVANITGVAVGRQAKAGFDVRAEGLVDHPPMTVYGSVETHGWVTKCCELLGLGRKAFRPIPVDAHYQINLNALADTISQDRRAGFLPICVVGNAGTVNTGAMDDLDRLADLCERENLWFHIDGALGGLAVLSETLKPHLRGIERADSIAFDLHKWGYLQYEIGCILVRDGIQHKQAFSTQADYLEPNGRGIQPDTLEFAQLGIQLSRGFRALRAWVALKTHGVQGIRRIIEQNVRHIQSFAQAVEAHKHLELLAPVPLNVACFRYVRPSLKTHELNAINREILLRIQDEGIAVPSSTMLDGRFAIRVAHTNHRTRQEDFEVLIEAVVRLGGLIQSAAK